MSVMIGHASIDERGRASGGQAGDQTGKEVCTRTWYNANWNKLIRPKSAAVAEKMARFVEAVCKGNMVGYDQGQRNTLRDVARAAGWDGSKIAAKCETDCSAFMTVAAEAAGISVPYMEGWNAPVTQTMCAAFAGTGAFDVLANTKYLTTDKHLKRGDILVRESGHTAMALTNGENVAVTAPTKTVAEIAQEVLNGKWGIGEDRRKALTAAGYDYDAVQAEVNRLLGEMETVNTGGEPVKEDEDMFDVSKLTGAECYEIVQKAQEYAGTLPCPSWAEEKVKLAKEHGVTDGTRPAAWPIRAEVAIMADRAAGGQTI